MVDAETQWSLGTFGAIAEFARDPTSRPMSGASAPALLAVTGRGGIRIEPHDDMRLFAFETTTKESWSPRVALCLPHERSAMNTRAVLTELGPDTEALRSEDRGGVLFDLGIDALQADACVRVADPAVAAKLRAYCGQRRSRPAIRPSG